MPARAQRLFKHTDEHRRWKMQELYTRKAPPPAEAPTILFWVPGGMPLLLHVEGVIAAALRLRGYNVHAIICDAPYKACVTREITTGLPIERWAEACAKCISSYERRPEHSRDSILVNRRLCARGKAGRASPARHGSGPA
jgi:hypothetical protein